MATWKVDLLGEKLCISHLANIFTGPELIISLDKHGFYNQLFPNTEDPRRKTCLHGHKQTNNRKIATNGRYLWLS